MSIPGIDVNSIQIKQLKDLQFEDRSAGRPFGRRICVKTETDTIDPATNAKKFISSEDITFKALFNKAQELSTTVQSAEDIEAIKAFLGRFKQMESVAATTYKNLPDYTLYKFRTWFHRLFDFGSYETKIDDLTDKLEKKYKKLSIAELSKLTPDQIVACLGNKSDEYLTKVIEHKLTTDPLSARDYFEKITDNKYQVILMHKVADAIYDSPLPRVKSESHPDGPPVPDRTNRLAAIDFIEKHAVKGLKDSIVFQYCTKTAKQAFNEPDYRTTSNENQWIKEVLILRINDPSMRLWMF